MHDPASIPPAEVRVDAALVRALLAEQHPDLAGEAVALAAEGWDNVMFRVGDGLAARLPRRQLGADLLAVEARWLPPLAERLGVPVPAPVRAGGPGCGYPWAWSIVPWHVGETADAHPLRPHGVRDFGRALRALHAPAPADAPVNPFRGVPLAARPDPLPALGALHAGAVPRPLQRVWRRALAAAPPGPPTWTHGDLHARNVLGAPDGGLVAVIDWGDLGAGDPAVDLSALWTVIHPADHTVFCSTYGPVDGPLLDRARGWALVFGTIFAGLDQDQDPDAVALGRRTLARLQG